MASTKPMEVDGVSVGTHTAIAMKKEAMLENNTDSVAAVDREPVDSGPPAAVLVNNDAAAAPAQTAAQQPPAAPQEPLLDVDDVVEAKHTAPHIQRDAPPPGDPATAVQPAESTPIEQQEDDDGDDSATQAPAGGAPLRLQTRPPPPLDRAELLNLLLFTNRAVVTPAVVPERLQLTVPREGYMCEQCGDRFLLASSLALHRSRRVMEIFFECPDCGRTRVFDNKCRFIEHLDGHGRLPETVDPETVDVAALEAHELSAPVRVLPLGSRVLTGPPKMTQMVTHHASKKPAQLSCPMCNTLCTSSSLADHMCPLAGPGSLEKMPPRCPECAQPCPSECALMAHQGLHKENLYPCPYVCPECGVKILGGHEEFRRHVVEQCLHLTRDLKNCCAICMIEVGDIRSHIQQTHTQKLFKCRKCPLAFESINGFNGHVQLKHDSEQMLGDTPYMPIIKCPFCAATFNHQKTLREHLQAKKPTHQLEMVRFVFRCPECDIDYGRKELLSDHLLQSHPDFKIADMDLINAETEKQLFTLQKPVPAPPPVQPPKKVTRIPPIRPVGVRMGRPPKNTTFVPPVVPPGILKSTDLLGGGVRRPRATAARQQLHTCIVCKSSFRRKSAYMEHARQHLSDGIPLCLLCNKSFENEELLKHHIADHACEIGRDRCGLCYAKLGSRDQLQYHLEVEHNLRNFTCRLCQMRFSRLNDLQRHNFAKHRSDGKGARPPPKPTMPHLLPEEDDDDVPLSALGTRKPRIADMDVKPDVDGAQKRKRLSAGDRGVPKSGKRLRTDETQTMPQLKRANGRSETPEQRKRDAQKPNSAAGKLEKPKPKEKSRAAFRCSCCGFGADSRERFLEHIVEHRQRGQHQCPECGQCYNTKPSLTKHLLLTHRLRDAPPEPEVLDRQHEAMKWQKLTKVGSAQQPGQCGICNARFANPELLRQHVRSHARDMQKARAQQQRVLVKPETMEAETMEDIAHFVAASQPPDDAEEEEEEEGVIELEMKEGEITTRQLRRAGAVPLQVRPDDSSDDDEAAAAAAGEQLADGPRDSLERELARMDGDGTDEKLDAVAAELKALTREGAADAERPALTANGHTQD